MDIVIDSNSMSGICDALIRLCSERDALRTQLETTKRELMATDISWQNALTELQKAREQVEILGDLLANAEIDIKALKEQKPAYKIDWQYDEGNEDPGLGGDLVLHQLDGKDYPIGTLFYAAPVPAMPIPKQEPIGKVCKSAECGGIDFYFDKIPDGETMIYSGPQPAQAAAIPDEPTGDMISAGIDAMNRGLGLFGDNHAQIVNNIWEDMYSEALYASPKQE